MSECPACGNGLTAGEDICSECGTDLSSMAQSAPEQSSIAATETPSAVVETSIEHQTSAEAIAPVSPVVEVVPVPIGPQGKIVLLRNGELTPNEFQVGASVQVGRFDPGTGPVDVDLGQLPEASYISRLHAEIKRNDDGIWSVNDLGSNNGTFHKAADASSFARIDGEQVIASGDEIALGNARFRFIVE